ncbi:hypothetical protein BSL78_24716 [Apostichopus japonicus]|uniref:Uncharacterized protein n=1 Tax=Stichopus japonicus TaxID=307972 RepID=A0A2G8JRP9_STIJA|nr:hypothetical protein BSL78_24716 [Apostichopus japonicus]
MAYYDQACVQQHSMMGFHDKCYRRFIDSKHIAARKRTVPEETPYDFKREKIEETKQKLWCIACSIYYMWEKKQYITGVANGAGQAAAGRDFRWSEVPLSMLKKLDTILDKEDIQILKEQSLPPTKDALIQHVKRCTNQAAIHSRALQQRIDALSPEGHGWKLENDDLIITWMTKPPDPDVLLQCVSSSCRVGKCLKGRCS